MSKSPSLRRIQADIRELARDPSDRYYAAPLENDMFEWYERKKKRILFFSFHVAIADALFLILRIACWEVPSARYLFDPLTRY